MRNTAGRPDAGAAESGVAAVELNGIAKRFGRRWVLRGVDLHLPPGSVLGLVGRNGSGKTTLLRMLATLHRPSRGSGRVFGHDLVREADDVRAQAGLLGHHAGMYPDLTAAENLHFAQRMLGLHGGAPAVEWALERVGLGRDADARVRYFSAGMQRRLALARLMLRPPRLLLLDEPHAAFDAEGIQLVYAFVQEVQSAGGAALVATHDPLRAGGLWTRLLLLEDGVLEATSLERIRRERTLLAEESPSPMVEEYVG